jgi:hypothetical protein
MDYSRIFGTKLFLSTELQNREILENLISNGYVWIRQKHIYHFQRLMRFPTVGRWVEVSRSGAGHYVPINSPAGRKLINKLCYI